MSSDDLDRLVAELDSRRTVAAESGVRLDGWLRVVADRGASDLLLLPGEPPSLRLQGHIVRSDGPVRPRVLQTSRELVVIPAGRLQGEALRHQSHIDKRRLDFLRKRRERPGGTDPGKKGHVASMEDELAVPQHTLNIRGRLGSPQQQIGGGGEELAILRLL
jgi:hypothetical protein